MKIAIIGTGLIATQMARTVSALDQVKKYAIASRSLDKAQAFADKWEFSRAIVFILPKI